MSTFSELIDFTRSSTGTYLDSVVYGDEIITNGDFSNGLTGWDNESEGTGTATVVNEQLVLTRTDASNRGRVDYQHTLETGKSYKLQFEIVSGTAQVKYKSSGSLSQYFNGENWNQIGVGIYTTVFVADGTDGEISIMAISSGSHTVDNITLVEVTSTAGGTPLLRTADTNEPRLEYDASGQPLGLLIEEQRSNNLSNSNNASVLELNALGITTAVNSSEVQAPSNTETVIKLNKTGSGYGYARFSYSTVTYAQTFSVFVKKGTARYVGLRQLNTSGSHQHTTFDLDTKTWTHTGYSHSRGYQDYGDGWLRLWVTEDGNTKSWASVAIVDANGEENNSQTGTLYVYGFQREAGAFPTSYIPTSGSTVTRNKDVCKVTAFKYHQNDQQGTLFVEGTPNISQATYRRVAEFEYSNLRFSIQTYTGKIGSFTRNAANSTNNSIGTQNPYTPYRTQKSAFTVSAGYAAKSNNGLDVQSETDVLGLDEPNVDLYIGQRANAIDLLCGHIKRVLYFPTKLSNDKLVELTKPSSSPTMSLTFDGQATSELVEGLHD